MLPTRDLVVQVRETFEAVAKGRGLKVTCNLLLSTGSISTEPANRLEPLLGNILSHMNKHSL